MLTLFESQKERFMPYSITEIEVTQPLPTISLSESDTGIALILRRKDKPIGFLMEALPAKSVLNAEYLAQLIATEIGTKLLQESIREELIKTAEFAHFPSLTVAICTKDRPDNLARCLKSLLNLQTPSDKVEILVIDNAPSDERTKELVASLPGVRYVLEPKPGLDFARNRALLSATSELLAFLDDDIVVDRKWLEGLMEAWAENQDAAAFTGLVLPYELATEAQILFEQRGGFRRGFEKIRYGQILPGNPLHPCGAGIFGAGCNMAFCRDILLKIGGFDEALDTGAPLPGGGDLDIFYRVIRAGYSLVYEPKYLVFHQHRREYEKLRRQYWTWGLGFMAFVIKSYQSDPPQRSQLRRLIWWWLKDQLQQFKDSLRGRHTLPPTMILAEFWGGIVGLLGEYSRSLKRVEQIRRQFS
ncbi:family 2 glycosyl transferase [Tolypothrix sp. NIES-4075]|uniref:glycosyltransferase family 2 protein n=1 Tax=Tolypothrix sp. NIES-4075 TaxID=2005459 RepID=UPI000B653404|nr:glycosyltransferase [Tolypothrix sp. NIES-4075]GAX42587.1 family 2 glycosyl transferase [Tolypothrix sp. NIES-4075]